MKCFNWRRTSALAVVVLCLSVSGYSQTSNGIWVNATELAKLPMSGAAWDKLKAQADASAGTPLLNDQDQNNNVYVLAKALVYARTGIEKYRTEVIDQCMRAINTELGGSTLALGRELAAYVIAADLVKLPSDKNETFRAWLRRTLTENLLDRTLQSTQEDRPNNWGTHAGASRAAVAAYLGDTAELARTAQIFRGWLGDRSAYAGFKWGTLDWHCDPTKPVGINPAGCMKSGHSIDGVLPDDQRRSETGFVWPPPKENYVWEALQGSIVTAEILHRRGYDAYNWSNKALLRAYTWLHTQANFPAEGDDQWQPHLVNYRYGTNFPEVLPARFGKNMGWTDWTHGPGRSDAEPAPEPTPTPEPEPTPVPEPEPTAPEPTPAPAPAPEPTSTTIKVEQNNSAVTYSGTWYTVKNSRLSNGSSARSASSGSKGTFTFNGTGVKWIGKQSRWTGIARVYLDGRLIGDVDTFSHQEKFQSVLYSVSGMASGTHTLTIEATGRMNTSAKAHWVWLDAFEYTTTVAALTETTSTYDVRLASTTDVSNTGSLNVGYAPLERTDAAPGPVGGVATLSFHQSSNLVTETGIPPSSLMESGRVYVEESEKVSTGLAFANPNDDANKVSFYFSDANGQTVASGTMDLPPRGQLARFTDEAPFNGQSSFVGALTFTSSLPVAVNAMRALVNERGDFILTTTAVADLTVSKREPGVIPHFAEGAGWSTETVMINPTDEAISGTIQFVGTTRPAVPYSIAPGGVAKLMADNSGGALQIGALRVVPSTLNASPVAFSVLGYEAGGTNVSEVGVQSVDTGRTFTLFAEKHMDLFNRVPGSTETGLAIFNPGVPTTLQFELIADGQTRFTATSNLPHDSHASLYLSQLPGFANVPNDFQGVLRITSTSSDISLIGVRSTWNERGDLLFSAVPAVNNELIHPNASYVFPHFAYGAGFSTRFVVFDNAAGQPGSLELFNSAGIAIP